jgi:long-chain acyl-CoA synthetase
MTMARYWRNPEATLRTMVDGFLRTGDLGRRDDQGYYYILDRRNEMIITGGENVYPREVEEILLEHPAVSEVAVFDVPDTKWVQKVVAAIVLRSGAAASADEIVANARCRLAAYKCPKEIHFVETLPRNSAGKVLRTHLRTAFSGRDIER